MRVRRFCGSVLMITGTAGIIAMLVLASIVITNHVEWDNAVDAVLTVAMVTVPPALASGLFILGGRKVYGSWHRRKPIRKGAAWVVRVAGILLTAVLGGMFLFLMAAGAGPEDRTAAVSLGLGTIMAIGISFIGFLMQPRHKHPPI